MALDFNKSAKIEINEFINGREQISEVCDFNISNIGWDVTIVITTNRLAMFNFTEPNPGILKMNEYAEIPLKDITEVNYNRQGSAIFGYFKVGKEKININSKYGEEGEAFLDVLDQVKGSGTGFVNWDFGVNKYSQNLPSFIHWIINTESFTDPGKIRNYGKWGTYALYAAIGLIILSIIFTTWALLWLIVICFVIMYFLQKFTRPTCRICNTEDSLYKLDSRQVDGFVVNIFYNCLKCGSKLIDSENIKK